MLDAAPETDVYYPLADPSTYQGAPLREWQKRALTDWEAADFCEAIEAVTGNGKLLVGIAAIHHTSSEMAARSSFVAKVVLVERWRRQVVQCMPKAWARNQL